MPIPTDWSPTASKLYPERGDITEFTRMQGQLMWMQVLGMYGPGVSVLARHTSNPSQLDIEFQHRLLRYYTGPVGAIEAHFYRGPEDFDR